MVGKYLIHLVRLTASPLALGVVAVAAALGVPHGSGAAWTAGLAAAGLVTLLTAAGTPDGWFRAEGEWLGTVPRPRWQLYGCAWLGVSVGAAFLVALVGAIAALGTEPGSPMELKAVAGSDRSRVLLPGDSLEQPLTGLERAPGEGLVARLHCTATLGASAPVTIVLAEAGGARRREIIARRTWVELPLEPGVVSVRLENVGEGALALLGPQPVQLWGTANVLLGGHLRLWGHGTLYLTTLVGLAMLFGVLMGPGVAAVLAFSLWLGLRMLSGSLWPGALEWMPGGSFMGSALDTMSRGRVPLPPAPATVLAAAASLAATVWLGGAAARGWHQESRR